MSGTKGETLTLNEIYKRALEINNNKNRIQHNIAIEYFYKKVLENFVSEKELMKAKNRYKKLEEKYKKLQGEVRNFKSCARMLGFNPKNFFNKSVPERQKFIQS